MPVAKSFQSFEFLTEPYIVGNKQYIKVRNPKTLTERQVRWYTDAEYAKMYPEETKPEEKITFNQKFALGFAAGHIYLFKGDCEAHSDWLHYSVARFNTLFGWFIEGAETIPADIPGGLELVKINWEEVGNPDNTLKPETAVKEVLNSYLYGESVSNFIGTIGQRLELTLKVVKVYKTDGYYGSSTLHIFEDSVGNCFTWSTSAKSWTVGEVKHIKGTVKDHTIYKGEKQTVLTRCQEVH